MRAGGRDETSAGDVPAPWPPSSGDVEGAADAASAASGDVESRADAASVSRLADIRAAGDDFGPAAARFFVSSAIAMAVFGAVLFTAAGTVHWPRGWLLLALYAGFSMAHGVVLGIVNPRLLVERSKGLRVPGVPAWDRRLVTLGIGLLPFASWVVAGLDAGAGWTRRFPGGIVPAAAAVYVAGWLLIIWASVANRHFATTVRVVDGQAVQTGGPYRLVRHPGYLGTMAFQAAAPLILGSWPALAVALAADVLVVARAALEDRFLLEHLEGYRAYAARVRYRLVPGVW